MSPSTEPAVIVRPANVADSLAMAAIRARSWRDTYERLVPPAVLERVEATQEAWAGRLTELLSDASSRTSMFVATRHGTVIGFAIWWPSGDGDATPETAEIRAIYLDPEAIGQGIGRLLFEATVEEIRSHGFTVATLWVLDTNERARRFYEAAGWRTDGATKEDRRPDGVLHEVRYRR